MCNFIIRPIKSYATVDTRAYNETTKSWEDVKRGETVVPKLVFGGCVYFDGEDGVERTVNLGDFVNVFTADPADVKKVKDEEAKWFPKPKEEKKDSKK